MKTIRKACKWNSVSSCSHRIYCINKKHAFPCCHYTCARKELVFYEMQCFIQCDRFIWGRISRTSCSLGHPARRRGESPVIYHSTRWPALLGLCTHRQAGLSQVRLLMAAETGSRGVNPPLGTSLWPGAAGGACGMGLLAVWCS